jgi:hypothetical protein
MNIKPTSGPYNTSPFDSWSDPFGGRYDPALSHDYTIRGKMYTAKFNERVSAGFAMTSVDAQSNNDFARHINYIKRVLAEELAANIMHSGAISYTKMQDPTSLDTIYLARCFLVPNEDVQLLRTLHSK